MSKINTQFPSNMNVANLNGANGFAFFGTIASGEVGNAVSMVGDINADGIGDLVIGAPYNSNVVGICFVIFGQLGSRGSASLSDSSLTGANGFIINGFTGADTLGCSTVSGIGDINGDGIADMAIGEGIIGGSGNSAYVVFGKSKIGSSGSINITSLTGASGFAITVGTGTVVSGIGDINADGIADFAVGVQVASSNVGACYIIFGRSGIGSSGTVAVTSLTGANGFKITGAIAGGELGSSVNGGLDVNGDGIHDLIVGATYAGSTGICYVLFGGPGIGSSGSISVSSLNGINGFTITSANGQRFGWSVSLVGDINSDGIGDLAIGDPNYGSAYVVFGKSGTGPSSMDVSSLNGVNGFNIIFPVSSSAGYGVSGVGDINGDGIADFGVGAITALSNGAGYVFFGHSGIGKSGSLDASSLMGTNGFIINFPSPSYGGNSISGGGDINGDGISDLIIGAYVAQVGSMVNAGASYAIFGEPTSFQWLTNHLSIQEGKTLTFNSQYLNVTCPKSSAWDTKLQFTLSGIQHGRFFASSNPGVSLTSFLQQQVRNSQIQFAHDGSPWAPAYNVSVSAPGMFINPILPQAATITFQQSFVLVNNQLAIDREETVILTSGDLSASDLYNSANNPSLIFVVSNVQHGYFALTSAPYTPITQFTQAQIQSGYVQFVQDGSGSSPSYSVAVINGAATIAAQPATVLFSNSGLSLTRNSLTINQNQTVILTFNNINATDPYSARFNFTVSNVQHGYFSLITAPLSSISSFTPTQIQKGLVQFRQDGSINPPSYSVMASDGQSSSITQAASVVFDVFPTLITNTLTIIQGQTVILTSQDLSATDSYNPGNNPSLIFSVSNIQHGYFALTSTPSIPIMQFTQAQIQIGKVTFVQDGSINAPDFDVVVTNKVGSTISQAATIYFQALPVLLQNSLTLNGGQSVVLTPLNLNATVPGNPPLANLIFTVSDVTKGYFAYIDFPTSPILSFSQADIDSGQVEFVSTSGSQTPTYSIAVSDGAATANSEPATITFGDAPQILVNQITISQGGTQYLNLNHLHAQAPDATNSTLLFLVDDVHHGRFENYGQSGTAVTNFTQQQIINQNIQFVHDGSNYAPSFSIVAFFKSLFSFSKKRYHLFALDPIATSGYYSATSPAKVWFQAGGITLPQLKYNRLYIVQGGKTILGSQELFAIDMQDSPVFNTTFLINGLTHGQFTSVMNPSTSYLNFSQSQVAAGDIQFVHDGSANVPSYQVIVNQGPYFSSPYPASIAFRPIYSPPQIIGQLTNQTITVDEAFSFPLTTSIFSDTTPLHFSATSVGGSQLPSWIHFDNATNYFSGVAATPGITPIQVTAKDAAHLTTSTFFSLKAQPQPQSQSHTSSGAIIGGVLGGVIGLMLLVMRCYIGRQAQITLQKAAEDEATQKITRILAKEIFEKVKLTGCCGYLSESNAKAYIKVIEDIVSKLEPVDKTQQISWIEEIANQIKKQANKSYCYSFFRPEITPQELLDKVEAIAQAVQQSLSGSKTISSASEDIEMSDVRVLSA